MPRTRRNKVVSLTKTPKRNTRSARATHIDAIREAAGQYSTCVVFLMANQRNVHLQEVRKLWKENSRIFVGKNRVMAKALGLDAESEVRPGLNAIGKRLMGPVGVLFTSTAPREVQEWFQDHGRDDFARAGGIATQDVVLDQGPVMIALEPPEQVPHSLEPQLRALGMPTELKRGVPTLLEKFVVCKTGDKLTAEKAQILKHLMIKDATFRLVPVAYWTQDDEAVTDFSLEAHDELLIDTYRKAAQKASTNPAKVKRKTNRAGVTAVVKAGDDDEDMDADEESDDDDEDLIDSRERGMMIPVGL